MAWQTEARTKWLLLAVAASFSTSTIIEHLCKQGADVSFRHPSGYTAMTLLCWNGLVGPSDKLASARVLDKYAGGARG